MTIILSAAVMGVLQNNDAAAAAPLKIAYGKQRNGLAGLNHRYIHTHMSTMGIASYYRVYPEKFKRECIYLVPCKKIMRNKKGGITAAEIIRTEEGTDIRSPVNIAAINT